MTDKWHWLRHKWSEWTPYIRNYAFHPYKEPGKSYECAELRQQRKCLTCGSLQDEAIADTNKILDAPIAKPHDWGGDIYADYTRQ